MLLALFLPACVDYEVKPEGSVPVFDPGDTAVPIDTDTHDTGGDSAPPIDTASCPDQTFPAGTLAPLDECGSAGPTVGTFTPVEEWAWDSFSVAPESNNVMMTPIVTPLVDTDGDGDVDGDDLPAIVFVTYSGTDWTTDGVLRAISGDGATELLNVTGESLAGTSNLAAADIDNDGSIDIIALTQDSKVKAFEADGTVKWTTASSGNVGNYGSAPAISDMDGDGEPEIVVGSLILNNDGTVRGEGSEGIGTAGVYCAASFAVDLDGDGTQEVVTGNALYDPDGNTIWYNGESDGYVAVADFDGDGIGEIVVSANAQVRLQDADGNVLWTATIPRATSGYGGPPTVADFDGDGEPEIGVAANSVYTVVDTDGSILWQVTTTDASSGVTGSSVFDFEGDGYAEAIYGDETRLWAYAGPDGAVKLESTDHSNWTVIEYPTIADVDADNEAEIVVPNGLHPSYGAALHGISVIGDADHSWRAGRRIWNQHAYHITNVEDDGTIPRVADRNWESYNNFRSGDIAAATSGSVEPNLTVKITDVCSAFCDLGHWMVWVQVGNTGLSDIDGTVSVELWATTETGDVWLGEQTVPAVPAGVLTESVLFDVYGVDSAAVRALVARVDGGDEDDGDWVECVEDDDEDVWNDVGCVE
jgi:hypothetical protein